MINISNERREEIGRHYPWLQCTSSGSYGKKKADLKEKSKIVQGLHNANSAIQL